MAFSWNPFKKNQPDEGIYNPSENSNNLNYQIFKDVDDDIDRIVSMRSAIDQYIEHTPSLNIGTPTFQTLIDNDSLLLPIISNKTERLNQYRTISQFTECDWCLDEICDDFLHEDEFGNYIKLTFGELNESLSETRKDILLNEFNKYISLFKLK